MTIGLGDASVIVVMVTDSKIINAIGGLAATGDPTGTVTGASATGTVEPGLAAAASGSLVVAPRGRT